MQAEETEWQRKAQHTSTVNFMLDFLKKNKQKTLGWVLALMYLYSGKRIGKQERIIWKKNGN